MLRYKLILISILSISLTSLYAFRPSSTEQLQEAVDLWVLDSIEAVYVHGHISTWDVSQLSSLGQVFRDKHSFNSDISSWDVSNVEDFYYTFSSAHQFNRDLSSWDVSNAISMHMMFQGCHSFESDLSSWDVSNVTDMHRMFNDVHNFTSDLSAWDVSMVNDMTGLFAACHNFTSDLSNWNVSNVEMFNSAFGECHSFESDLSNWDMSSAENIADMFSQAHAFNSDLTSWNVSNVTDMSATFYNAYSFDCNISVWDQHIANVQSFNDMIVETSISYENRCDIEERFSLVNENWNNNICVMEAPSTVNLTFNVDMSDQEVHSDGVWIRGGQFGSTGHAMTLSENNETVWTHTLEVDTSSMVTWKYSNGPRPADDEWGGGWESEALLYSGGCSIGEYNDRAFFVQYEDVEMPVVCFGRCVSCDTPQEMITVEFNLDMTGVDTYESGPSLAGGIFFGQPGNYQMTERYEMDDIWTIQVEVPIGVNNSTHYTFVNGDSWELKEHISGQDCAFPDHYDDRYFEWGQEDILIEACFAECGDGFCDNMNPPSENIVENGGFEMDFDNWVDYNTWYNNFMDIDIELDVNGTPSIESRDFEAYEGEKSLRLENISGSYDGVEGSISLAYYVNANDLPEGVDRFATFSYATNFPVPMGTSIANAFVNFYDSNNESIYGIFLDQMPNTTELNTWQFLESEIQAIPDEAVTAAVFCYLLKNPEEYGDEHIVFFDDFKVQVSYENEQTQSFVNFKVDMRYIEVHPDGVYLAGGSFGQEGHLMHDDDLDGVWEVDMLLDHNTEYLYKFRNQPSYGTWDGFESPNALIEEGCNFGEFDDRMVYVSEEDIELPEVCYGECEECREFSGNVFVYNGGFEEDGLYPWEPFMTGNDDIDVSGHVEKVGGDYFSFTQGTNEYLFNPFEGDSALFLGSSNEPISEGNNIAVTHWSNTQFIEPNSESGLFEFIYTPSYSGSEDLFEFYSALEYFDVDGNFLASFYSAHTSEYSELIDDMDANIYVMNIPHDIPAEAVIVRASFHVVNEIDGLDELLNYVFIDDVQLYLNSDEEPEFPGLTFLGGYEGSDYYVSNDVSDVWLAREHAASIGGHLVTYSDPDEQDAVSSMIGQDIEYYIGLSDEVNEGEFEWDTREPLMYTNWGDGEPNNSGNDEDYVVVWPTGFWNDAPGEWDMLYVIEVDGLNPPDNENMVRNGSFEFESENEEWVSSHDGNYAYTTNGDEMHNSSDLFQAFEGERSLKIWGTYDEYQPFTTIRQIIPLDQSFYGDTLYGEVTMMSHVDDFLEIIITENENGNLDTAVTISWVNLSFIDSDGQDIGPINVDGFSGTAVYNPFLETPNEWKTFEVASIVPEGVNAVVVSLNLWQQTIENDGSIFFDAVKLKRSNGLNPPNNENFVYGYVFNELEGSPVEGARVEYYNNNVYEESYTNSDGYYDLVVPDGSYTTFVYADGFYEREDDWNIGGGGEHQIDFYLQPLDSENFFMISGTVMSSAGGRIAGANVKVVNEDEGYSNWDIFTDDSGYYQVWLEQGAYTLSARANTFYVESSETMLIENDMTLDFMMNPIESFTGAAEGHNLTFTAADAPRYAYVHIYNDEYDASYYTGDDGYYYLDLVNGVYDFYAYDDQNDISIYQPDAIVIENNVVQYDFVFPVDGFMLPPTIELAHDVDNDQGRQMRVVWSSGEPGDYDYFTQFSIWRHVDGSDGYLWDYIETIPWHGFDPYSAVVPTLGDSTDAGMHWSTFMVTAHTDNPDFFLDSEPVSGYSIDNIHPGAPQGLFAGSTGEGIMLTWDHADDEDFSYHKVYRQDQDSPDVAEIFETVDTFFVDQSATDGSWEYWVTSVDMNGNESTVSDVVSLLLSADESLMVPDQFAMQQNYPNPFNPSTQIRYALDKDSHVTLSIYDMMGRKVKTLVRESQSAGYQTLMWNATNDMGNPVSAGVYLYSIQAGENHKTMKMILLK